jgi:membrane protease YdiL (CAAX protease family)
MTVPPNRAAVRGGVVLAILLLTLFVLFGGLGIRYVFGFRQVTASYLYVTRLVIWLLLLAVWQYSVRVERQPLLIWPEKKYSFWGYLLSLVAITTAVWVGLIVVGMVILVVFHRAESSQLFTDTVRVFKTSPLLAIFTALTAGVTEELICRGYLLPRLNILLKSPLWAIVVSTLIFSLAHLGYGTIINVAVPVIIGLALAFYYWQYRNIKVVIIFHVCWDLMVIYLATRRG